MSSQTLLSKPPRTPASQRTRSNIGYKLHSPLKQHKPILQPLNVHLHSSSHHKAPSSPFTLSVDLKPTPFMPPKAGSTTTRDAAKRKATKQNTLNFQKTRPIGSTLVPATLSAAQTRAKRAHSPHSSPDPDDAPAKRFKPEAASLGAEVETASSGGSLPPSSADHSMSVASAASEPMTVAAESIPDVKTPASDPPSYSSAPEETKKSEELSNPSSSQQPRTPPRPSTSQVPISAARIEISKTPKAPWLTGSKVPMIKVSPIKRSVSKSLKPLARTPIRPPADLRFPTSSHDLVPSTSAAANAASSSKSDPFESEAIERVDASDQPQDDKALPPIPNSSSTTIKQTSTALNQPTNIRNIGYKSIIPVNRNVSAAFAVPISLSPTKTPAKPFMSTKAVARPSPANIKKQTKPSILQRAGTSSNLALGSNADPSSSKSPLSSTLAALMNRTTVDPHAATQAQLSSLSQALEELDAPRPPSSMGQRPPLSRPSTSLGHSEPPRTGANKGKVSGKQATLARPGMSRVPNVRPGSALAITPVSRFTKPSAISGAKPVASIGNGHPPVATTSAPTIEARRASTASLALSQSLPVAVKGKRPPVPVYTTQSGRRVVSAAARASGLPSSSAAKDTSQDNMSVSNASEGNVAVSPREGNKNIPKSPVRAAPLEILKDCVIFVDVRTEDGEDAGSLFVDMLRGLGAKILSKPGSSLTHIVYKSGLQSTLTKFRTLPEPKPAVVGIGWVVECVEKREKVDVTRYIISLEEEAGSALEGLKNAGKASNPSKKEGKSLQTKLQFKSVKPVPRGPS